MAGLIVPFVDYTQVVNDLARTILATITKSTLLLPDNGSTIPLSIAYVEWKRRVYAVAQSAAAIFPLLWQNLEVGGAANAIGVLTPYPQALTDILNQVPPGELSAAQARQAAQWSQINSFEVAQRRVFYILRDAMIESGGPWYRSLALINQPATADGTVFQSAEGQTLRGIIVAYNAAIKAPDAAVLGNHEATIERRQRQGENFTEYIAEKENLYAEAVRNGRTYPDYKKIETIINNMLPMYDEIIDKFDSEFTIDAERTLLAFKTFMVARASRVETTAATRAPLRTPGGRAMETGTNPTPDSASEAHTISADDITQFLGLSINATNTGGPPSVTADQLLKHIKINDALKEMGYYHRKDKSSTPSNTQRNAKTSATGTTPRTPRTSTGTGTDLSSATYCFTHGYYANPAYGHTGLECKTFAGPDNKRKATGKNTMGGSMKVTF